MRIKQNNQARKKHRLRLFTNTVMGI